MKSNVGGVFATKCKSVIWKAPALTAGYESYGDNMPYEEYIKWQRGCLAEMMRLIPADGAIFYNHKFRIQKGLLLDRREITEGFPVRQMIIWSRKCGVNFNQNYFLPTYEVIFLIAKPKFKLAKGANKLSDVWVVSPERNNAHPAPFPLEIAERVISSTDSNTILDPFMGSGTTLLASQRLGRKAIGVELSEEYCEIAVKRLQQQELGL